MSGCRADRYVCCKVAHEIKQGYQLCAGFFLLQVWMYCRLYRTMDRFHKPEILEAAKAGKCAVSKFITKITLPEQNKLAVHLRDLSLVVLAISR